MRAPYSKPALSRPQGVIGGRMLYLIAGSSIALGALFGLVFRLLFFVVILVLAVAGVVIGDFARGEGGMLLHVVVAVVGLEVGYVVGIGIRAMAQRGQVRRGG